MSKAPAAMRTMPASHWVPKYMGMKTSETATGPVRVTAFTGMPTRMMPRAMLSRANPKTPATNLESATAMARNISLSPGGSGSVLALTPKFLLLP